MIIFFKYTHDRIQKGVKLETSLLADRRDQMTKDGTVISNFDQLVMDEAYDILFRRLFFEAHAEIISGIPSHFVAETPTDITAMRVDNFESADYNTDRDFNLWLKVSDDFVRQTKKAIDIMIEQYIIDYICWRWFETKLPQDAVNYYNRLENTLNKIKLQLNRRIKPIRRVMSFP